MNMCALSIAQQSDWLTTKVFGAAGASPLARESDAIFMWIFWFSTFWFVLLMGLMGYWVVKYRRRLALCILPQALIERKVKKLVKYKRLRHSLIINGDCPLFFHKYVV